MASGSSLLTPASPGPPVAKSPRDGGEDLTIRFQSVKDVFEFLDHVDGDFLRVSGMHDLTCL